MLQTGATGGTAACQLEERTVGVDASTREQAHTLTALHTKKTSAQIHRMQNKTVKKTHEETIRVILSF